MRIDIAKKDLDEALLLVSNTLASSSTDISSHFVFRVTPDKNGVERVEILAYTGRLFSKAILKGANPEDTKDYKAFTVEGKRLLKWLAVAPQSMLTIEYEGGSTVKFSTPKGDMEFQSLNPANFNYWDKRLDECKKVCTIKASVLATVIGYARLFNAPDQASASPELSVSEMRNGSLYSGDRKTATQVHISELATTNLRIHYNDGGNIIKFLNSLGDDEEVSIFESDGATFFVRFDDSHIGNARYKVNFPEIPMPALDHEDMIWWELPKDEIKWAIDFLSAGADDKDNRLRFLWPNSGGSVHVAMVAMTGKEHVQKVNLDQAKSGRQPNAPDLPDRGFLLSRPQLQRVLASWEGDTVRFGITLKGASGYVRFLQEREGVTYQTLMVWLRA